MQLTDKEKKYLDITGKFYSAEKRYRRYSEYLLIAVFGLSSFNSVLDGFSLTNQNIVFSLSLVITLLSLLSIILEKFSKTNKNFGDEGRRLIFFNNLIKEGLIINAFMRLNVKSKNKKSPRTNYDNYYFHDVKNIQAQKALNFYESIFYEYYTRNLYKRKIQLKYIVFWFLLFAIILFGLTFGSQNLRVVITNFITITILSSFAIETIFLVFDWEEKSSKLKAILDAIPSINDVNTLLFQFLEYTIVIRNVPSIPDNFFEKVKSEIEADYKKNSNSLEMKIAENWN